MKLKKHLSIFLAVVVAVAMWGLYLLLLPWFTYARAYVFIGGGVFAGAGMTLYLAWRAHRSENEVISARSRYLLWQGIGMFGIGVAWLIISRGLPIGK